MYPLKFIPPYKDYLWGGRNLEKFGKKLPQDSVVAESWEVSCHKDGESVIENGIFKGQTLTQLFMTNPKELLGNQLTLKGQHEFPILLKLIDANDKLSVQVHPNDDYAQKHENSRFGKTEMWYVLSCKPNAKLLYDVIDGTTREVFEKAIQDKRIHQCIKSINVTPGDVINIPAGVLHAIGDGIVLAEVQQSSNVTYRVYDYDRVDKNGTQRPLHIDRALEVIDFNSIGRKEKATGLEIKTDSVSRQIYVVNEYFAVETLTVDGTYVANTNGESYHVYFIIDGNCEIRSLEGIVTACLGESVLLPANLGSYQMQGKFKALKSYIPDFATDITGYLIAQGYTKDQILENIAGLSPAQVDLINNY